MIFRWSFVLVAFDIGDAKRIVLGINKVAVLKHKKSTSVRESRAVGGKSMRPTFRPVQDTARPLGKQQERRTPFLQNCQKWPVTETATCAPSMLYETVPYEGNVSLCYHCTDRTPSRLNMFRMITFAIIDFFP